MNNELRITNIMLELSKKIETFASKAVSEESTKEEIKNMYKQILIFITDFKKSLPENSTDFEVVEAETFIKDARNWIDQILKAYIRKNLDTSSYVSIKQAYEDYGISQKN